VADQRARPSGSARRRLSGRCASVGRWPFDDPRESRSTVHSNHIANLQRADTTVRHAELTDVWIDLSHVASQAAGATLFLGIHEDDLFDKAQMASWIRQAAAMPGWLQPGPDGKVQ
jgi:hypothetical protein